MHYQNDLSLSEIAEELSISRQAVRDQLLRTEKILQGYEETLHLISRFQEQRRAVEEMKAVMEAMEREPLDGFTSRIAAFTSASVSLPFPRSCLNTSCSLPERFSKAITRPLPAGNWQGSCAGRAGILCW